MSNLTKLKAAASLHDLAVLLGYSASSLAYILYKIPEHSKYTEFEIPKQSGGKRKISAPIPSLKAVQRRLANLLYSCVSEIEKTPPIRKPLSHGFSRDRSIITNAAQHKRRRYVFNIDIEDFFPTFNFGRVRGFFIKDKTFALAPDVATVIAKIACHDNKLPQGSPSSPVISNLIANVLDVRLVGLAKANNCTYSRYADDITFSTNQATFPTSIAAPDPLEPGGWKPGSNLVSYVTKAGFKINPKKTRMQVRGSRQLTTGLLVNLKVNIRPEYYRAVRAMCANVFASGSYYRMTPAALVGAAPTEPPIKTPEPSLAALQGMLSHIHHVRDSVDRRDSADKKKNATATRKLYRKFLHYKNFVALDRPLIVTEGSTDQIYLRAAIEKLTAFHGGLGSPTSSGFAFAVSFMKYGATNHDILQLGGGTGDLKFLMLHHRELLPTYKHAPLLHPVIVVTDNDDGAKPLFSVASELGVTGLSHSSTDDFFRIYKNLYLVKTPSTAAKTKTCIEDLFQPALLAATLNGKSFNPNKEHGDESTYGKTKFAEKVVQPNKDTIDFSGFSPLLDRITKVLADYKP